MTSDQLSTGSGASGQPRAFSSLVVRELAAATATLTADHDTVGTATLLLAGCARAVGAMAGGLVLTRPDDQQLELLASTSHRAHELELYQIQLDEGPCVEAVDTAAAVSITGLDKLGAKWPALVDPFRAAGFHGIHATPLRWNGRALGALNLFFAAGEDADGVAEVSQAFADIATVTIVHAERLSPQDVIAQTRSALDERVVIERAKGVLAYTEQLPLDQAFDRLLALATDAGRPLRQIAAQIVATAAGTTPLAD
jgi:hypothetical protein